MRPLTFAIGVFLGAALAQASSTGGLGSSTLSCIGGAPDYCTSRTNVGVVPDPWLVPIATITGNSGSGTVNVATAIPHGLIAGQQINISGVWDSNNSGTPQTANTDYNTFGSAVTVTVDSATSFHYISTVSSAVVTNSGYVVTQPVPAVNQVFVDSITGVRGVRATCSDTILSAGYSHTWCGPDPGIWTNHGSVHSQGWATNNGSAIGQIGVYCPPSGTMSINGSPYSCWHPGKYNFYVNELSGPNLHGGGTAIGAFDPVTLQTAVIPIGWPAVGTYTTPQSAGSMWWSKTNPDVLYYSAPVSGSNGAGVYQLNVKTGTLTLALDPTNCGVPITAANLTGEGTQAFVSDDDRYINWAGGGIWAGTPNQKDYQNGWIYNVVLDTQANPDPLCYWWNTASGMVGTWDTVTHAMVGSPTQLVDTAFAGNPPAAQTPAPPAPTVTPTSGGSLPSGTYYVRATYVNWAEATTYTTFSGGDTGMVMESAPSPEVSVTLAGGNHSFSVPPPAVPSSSYPANYNMVWPQAYNVYASSTSGAEVSQTPFVQGPNTPGATATTGGSITAGSYLVQWSYATTTGGKSNAGGESNASTVSACVTIAGSNSAMSIAEPPALPGGSQEESGWYAYVATNSATCPTVSAGTYYRAPGAPFAVGSGAQLLTTVPSSGTQAIAVRFNTTGALPIGSSSGIPTGTTFTTPASWLALLTGTAAPPSTGAAGFTMHQQVMNLVAASSGVNAIWLKASSIQESMSPSGGTQQQFDVFWNVGTNVAHLCGDVYGPDGTTNWPCGGHPASGYAQLVENTNTQVEAYKFFAKAFTSLGSGSYLAAPPPVSPPAQSYVDMHQAWQSDSAHDTGPMCFTPTDTIGDITGSGWAMSIRRAWDQWFDCLATDGTNRAFRMFNVHGGSFGSLLANWVAANAVYGVALLDNCTPSYDGKFAICEADWYGNIPTLNGAIPAGNPTPNAPGEDVFIYELR